MATADDVLRIAAGEIGYYAPDDPLAGSKYGRWMTAVTGNSYYSGSSTAVPWCAMFVSWVFAQAGQNFPGMPSAACADILYGGQNKGLGVSVGSMRRGDIVVFDWKDGGITTDHIGIVESVGSGSFTTIEGNTAGNRVARQTRYTGDVLGVVRPQYEGGGTAGGSASVSSMQSLLNGKLSAFGLSGVGVTGAYDAQTQRGLVRLLQASQNLDFGCGLSVDGYVGAATAAAMDAHPVGQGGETQGNDCWAVKAMLVGNGWELDLGNWYIRQAELSALAGHKPYHGLPATPVCDGRTLRSLATAVSV